MGLGVFAAEESDPFDPVELAALQAFKVSSGNSAELWSWTGDDPCRERALGWAGVSCTGLLQPTVTRLRLQGSQSSPSDIAGDVATLGPLVRLTDLDLHYTVVFGTIPPAYGNMTALTILRLYNTQLSGTIPPELGQLTALNYLALSSTQLSGTIPDALGDLAALGQPFLQGTQLSGTVPAVLGDLAALTQLWLMGTGVTGCPDFCSRHPTPTWGPNP